MKMTGMFRIALLPGTDEDAFVKQMTGSVFNNASAMQSTRITTGITHALWKKAGDFPEYVWVATIDLMTDRGYDYAGNLDRVRKFVEGSGIVTGLDVYTHVES